MSAEILSVGLLGTATAVPFGPIVGVVTGIVFFLLVCGFVGFCHLLTDEPRPRSFAALGSIILVLLASALTAGSTSSPKESSLGTYLEDKETALATCSFGLAQCREELERKAFFDSNDYAYRIWDLREATRTEIKIGSCPDIPCAMIRFTGVESALDSIRREEQMATFSLGGHLNDSNGRLGLRSHNVLKMQIPLRRGCYGNATLGNAQFRVVIADDRINSLIAWAAFRWGEHGNQEGFSISPMEVGCDVSELVD